MKLSLRVNTPEDSESDSSGISDYSKLERVLENELVEIFPVSKNYEFAEISLTFVSPEEIRALNKNYRDTDEATDVLSFPLLEDEPVGIPELPVLALGDIVICPQETERLHPELKSDEAILLMIAHSFLHLLGYDHVDENEQKVMWDMQEKIAKKLSEVSK